MKIYWRYRCDHGHEWQIFRDENAEETVEDSKCSYGHLAITLEKRKPVDEVQISIRPAGFVSDPVTKQVALPKRYRLIISDLAADKGELESALTYTWEDAMKAAEKFQNLSVAQAWQLWSRLNL